MNPVSDTLIWLINFPAQNGFPMIFVAVIALVGLGLRISRKPGGASSRLQELRVQEGLAPAPTPDRVRERWWRIQRVVYQVIAVVLFLGGVIGLLSTTGVDITEPYIAKYGVSTEGVYDDYVVTFTAEDGVGYSLPVSFFTSPAYPDQSAFIGWDETVTVTYLPGHPQAFIINTEG